MKNYLLFIFISIFTFIFSQDEIKYYTPPSFFNDIVKIDCENVLSTEKLCKLKLTVNNISNAEYFVLNTKKIAFKYEGLGTYFPTKGKNLIISPKSKKSRVIKIDDSMDYRVNSFKVILKSLRHGLKEDDLNIDDLTIEIGKKAELKGENISIYCEKSNSKKGKVSLNIVIRSSLNESELLNFNPNNFIIKNSEGKELEYKLSINKEFNFLGNLEKKNKISFESEESSFKISSENVFYLINLKAIEVQPFAISNGNKPVAAPITPSPPQNDSRCNSFIGEKNGLVEVLMMTDEENCFKMEVDDFTIVPTFSKVAKIYLNSGSHKFKIILENNEIVEKKIFIADTYSSIGYNVKKKNNGLYTINYLAFKQVLNEKGLEEQRKNK